MNNKNNTTEKIIDVQLKSEIDSTPKHPDFFRPSLDNSSGGDENEWRRSWRPDLKCCPWKLLQTADSVYLMKSHFCEDSYQFLITDLSKFWYESISHSEFSKRLQELNPNLEAPTHKILDHIKNNLEKNTADHLNIVKEENKSRINVWINSDLAGFPFCWQMVAEPAHEEMVSENTTVPLLMMVSELLRRQKELFQIITEKDKEINNYKAQGCQLTKKTLSTLPFDETVFERKMLFSQEFEDHVKLFGTSAFESSGQELYQSIMTKYAWLQKSTNVEAGSTDDGADKDTFESGDATERSPQKPSWSQRLPPSLTQQFGTFQTTQNTQKSPIKSPKSSEKNEEATRREKLQQKLALEEQKKAEKQKKKRKLAL